MLFTAFPADTELMSGNVAQAVRAISLMASMRWVEQTQDAEPFAEFPYGTSALTDKGMGIVQAKQGKMDEFQWNLVLDSLTSHTFFNPECSVPAFMLGWNGLEENFEFRCPPLV